jgi:hypothetical protein
MNLTPSIQSPLGLIALFALVACERTADHDVAKAPTLSTAASNRGSGGGLVAQDGLLYGRITMQDGAVHEGRLRWGGDEEALWSNYFNGRKRGNQWAAFATREQLPSERMGIRLLGKEIVGWDHVLDLGRPFMARFGDIARIEPRGREIQVTLKSGSVVTLARYAADDLADGVRVWDTRGGFVDLGEWKIRTIEFFPAPVPNVASAPLYGTVRTRAGEFTGLVQWNRQACLGSDELTGNSTNGAQRMRFDTIRSITRRTDGALVTQLDGTEIALSGAMRENSGVYVDDVRYGRVLISWEAFERVDFTPGGAAPAYGDYRPGQALRGDILTRSGRRLAGRLVFDLDESETTETLDAPLQGVDYTLPFSLIASIVPGGPADRAAVTLLSGEVLHLERWGDLGTLNAGILIFLEGRERPELVPWAAVARVDFERKR